MIPIRDSTWRGSTPHVTRALIVLNVLVFLAMLTLADTRSPTTGVLITTNENAQAALVDGVFRRPLQVYLSSPRNDFTLRFGAVPEFVTGYLDGTDAAHDLVESTTITARGDLSAGGVNLLDGFFLLLTPLTAMFLHGGWLHLIGNMLFLWVFGDNVEDRLGRWRFALFYGLCGYLAAAAHIWIDSSDLVPMIGASGAIAGVLGAYLLLFPRAVVQVLVPLFLFIPLVVPAPLMIGIWFLMNLISGVGAIVQTSAGSGGTAWFAHLGGFAAGMLLIYPLLIGRWRAPRAAVGPTWSLPPALQRSLRTPGVIGRWRPTGAEPPQPATREPPLLLTPPRPRRALLRFPFRRARRRGGTDVYRKFDDR